MTKYLARIGTALLVVAAVMWPAGASEATYPGLPGRIAFLASRGTDAGIYTVRPDGAGLRFLASDEVINDEAWSADGHRIVFTGLSFVEIIRPDGQFVRTVNREGAELGGTDFSPDGRQIAFTKYGVTARIYLVPSDGGNERPITSRAFYSESPAWSPDGRSIAFSRVGSGVSQIAVMDPTGAGITQLTRGDAEHRSPDWSPDGAQILYTVSPAGSIAPNSIWVMDADGSAPRQLSPPGVSDSDPVWSPDGSAIAFERNGMIYVMRADGTDAHPVIAGFDPSWQPLAR